MKITRKNIKLLKRDKCKSDKIIKNILIFKINLGIVSVDREEIGFRGFFVVPPLVEHRVHQLALVDTVRTNLKNLKFFFFLYFTTIYFSTKKNWEKTHHPLLRVDEANFHRFRGRCLTQEQIRRRLGKELSAVPENSDSFFTVNTCPKARVRRNSVWDKVLTFEIKVLATILF